MKNKVFHPIGIDMPFWGTWSFAYQRGYSQGSSDEYYCWKQEPTRSDNWDGKITGRRDMSRLLGGKSVPQVAAVSTPTFELDPQTGKVVQKRWKIRLTTMPCSERRRAIAVAIGTPLGRRR